jgi:hypothetical protein
MFQSILTSGPESATLAAMPTSAFQDNRRWLRGSFVGDQSPWLVGFSGGNRFDEKGEAARDPDDVS